MSPELSPPLESDPPSRDEMLPRDQLHVSRDQLPTRSDHVSRDDLPNRSDHIASLSSLISSQSRPSEIRGLPTSLLPSNQEGLLGSRDQDALLLSRDLDNDNQRTETISLNSEHSVDF